jgi:UDP-glucuronate decarboxylase
MNIEDGRVISNFIVQALRNEPITLYGDGTQSRSFCYADDLIAGFITLMNKKGLHTPVNLGNPVEKTMIEIAKIIIELTQSNSSMIHCPLPIDDPKQRCPDISKAIAELAWEPQIDLTSGLQQTIDYFKKALNHSTGFAHELHPISNHTLL